MSFRFKNSTVTLDNYKQVFKVCTPDVLDEIRSAVLDDTPISAFIKPCGTDSYKLGQFRMALRELIPVEYLNKNLTGRTVYNIRQGYAKTRDMSPLLKYFDKLDAETIEKLSDFVLSGTDISSVDFTIVPTSLVDTVCKGLYKGYPMWLLIEDGCTLNISQINVLMRGLSLGIDVHPFLNGLWDNNCLYLLFSYAKSVDINNVIPLINHNFDSEMLKVLLDLASRDVDITSLCIKDTEGIPVYNQYQMYEIGLAIEDGTVTNEMYKATLSDMEIADLHNKELKAKNRKLNTSLGKKSKKS